MIIHDEHIVYDSTITSRNSAEKLWHDANAMLGVALIAATAWNLGVIGGLGSWIRASAELGLPNSESDWNGVSARQLKGVRKTVDDFGAVVEHVGRPVLWACAYFADNNYRSTVIGSNIRAGRAARSAPVRT